MTRFHPSTRSPSSRCPHPGLLSPTPLCLSPTGPSRRPSRTRCPTPCPTVPRCPNPSRRPSPRSEGAGSDFVRRPWEDSGVFDSLKGRLLVATPDLGDPNFERAVVLMLEHTPDGAVGVVLNRPTETTLSEAATDWEGWDALAVPPAVVFVGGPVAQSAVICVARRRGAGEAEGFQAVVEGVGVADLRRPPAQVEAMRIFAGYSGWGGGQLEGELAAGAWFVLDALPEDPLGARPDALWSDVLRRQGGRLALFAACPADPSLN